MLANIDSLSTAKVRGSTPRLERLCGPRPAGLLRSTKTRRVAQLGIEPFVVLATTLAHAMWAKTGISSSENRLRATPMLKILDCERPARWLTSATHQRESSHIGHWFILIIIQMSSQSGELPQQHPLESKRCPSEKTRSSMAVTPSSCLALCPTKTDPPPLHRLGSSVRTRAQARRKAND